MPPYSVVIPFFEDGNCIENAILSIINQTFKPVKIIIVDDASKKNFFPIKIIKDLLKKKNINLEFISLKKNKGPGYCRNIGVNKVETDWVAFLDADDIWHQKKSEVQMQCTLKNNYFFSSVLSDRSQKIISKNYNNYITFIKLLYFNSIITSGVLINKKLIYVKFKDWHYAEDYFCWLKILKKNFKCLIINQILVTNNLTTNNGKRLSENKIITSFFVIKAYLYQLNFKTFLFIFFAIIFEIVKIPLRFILKLFK